MKTATLAITEKHTQGARFIVNKINVAFMQVAKETCLSAARTDVRIQITKQNGGTPRYSPLHVHVMLMYYYITVTYVLYTSPFSCK